MNSLKQILVPIDFSEVSLNALGVAEKISALTGGDIHLIHVYHVPVVDPYIPAETIRLMLEETEKASKEQMDKLVLSRNGLNKARVACVQGFPKDEILLYAKENQIDFIVMGTTGASGLKEMIFGSNAASIIEESECPVLAIPDEMVSFNPKNMVYASDLVDDEIPVLEKLVEFASLFDSEITLLHVNKDGDPSENEVIASKFNRFKQYIDYRNIKLNIINDDLVSDAINQYVLDHGYNIIGMAIHKRNFFEKLFHSSLTKKMAYHCHVPLWTFHKK